jgi:hypothetical protein
VRYVLVGVVMTVLSCLAAILLRGDGPGSGDVLLALGDSHGINHGDVAILALWAIGMAAAGFLVRR